MNKRPTLTLAEAARRGDRSLTTLRKWVRSGEIEGATHNADGSWSLPIDGLLQAGVRLDAPTPAPTPEPNDQVSDLERELDRIRQRLHSAEQLLEAERKRADVGELALRALTERAESTVAASRDQTPSEGSGTAAAATIHGDRDNAQEDRFVRRLRNAVRAIRGK